MDTSLSHHTQYSNTQNPFSLLYDLPPHSVQFICELTFLCLWFSSSLPIQTVSGDFIDVTFEVFMAVKSEFMLFWVALFSVVVGYQCVGGLCCLHLQCL